MAIYMHIFACNNGTFTPTDLPQPAVRDLQLVKACEELGLKRLVAWLTEVLLRPADVCDVAALPAHVYVQMARKMHVKYEGPPSPSPGPSGRPSLDLPGPATAT